MPLDRRVGRSWPMTPGVCETGAKATPMDWIWGGVELRGW